MGDLTVPSAGPKTKTYTHSSVLQFKAVYENYGESKECWKVYRSTTRKEPTMFLIKSKKKKTNKENTGFSAIAIAPIQLRTATENPGMSISPPTVWVTQTHYASKQAVLIHQKLYRICLQL